MATSASHLMCPACLQEYNIPKLLPCLHSVCQKCLETFIKNSTVSEEKLYQFQCPVCMKIVTKPLFDMSVDQWVGHFPINAVLLSLLPTMKAKVDQICDPCVYEGTSIAAKSYCATCKEALCELCYSAHRKSRASREHTFLTLDETADNPVALSLAFGITCTYHLNKDLEFYCTSHDSMCCSHCVVDHHRGCNKILKLKQHTDKLFNAKGPLEMTERIKQLESHLDKYTAANNETLQKLEISTKDMTNEIDKLIKTLNEAKSNISVEREALLEEESRKRLDESQRCQSLKAALRDSLILLSAVVKYGNKHHSLVMLHKIKEQLAYSEKTIYDTYSEVRQVEARLTMNEHFISLRKITGSQIGKITMAENKLKLCLPFQHNYEVSSNLIQTMSDEGISFNSTTPRDLASDDDLTAVEKSSDSDGPMMTESVSEIFEGREVCTDGYNMILEPVRGIMITSEATASYLSLPSSWTKMDPRENMKCVTLNPRDKEYKDVSQKFLASSAYRYGIHYGSLMNYDSSRLTVVQIERVQNKTLYQQYKAKKRHMETQNKGVANEKELWYGTACTNVANIRNHGFNRSYGGSGSHGAGTYFAVNASYSVSGYCSPDASGHRHIYLANVLTGDSVVAGAGTRVLPPKDPHYPHITYDSTIDNKTNPKMFVIFHDTQAYPSYHITFY